MDINKRNIRLLGLLGFGFTSLLGAALHFLYGMTGSTAAALFSSVNESTWEHMKLLFFPMLLFAVIQRFIMKGMDGGYWCVKLAGTVLGLLLIPVLFYTLTGIFGTLPDWVNIAIFFASSAAAYIYETRRFISGGKCRYETAAIFAFALIAAAFWLFTFLPPEIPLFQDPLTGLYGIA